MFQKYILTPTWCFVSEKMKDVFKVSHDQVGDAMISFIRVHTYICGLLQALEPTLTKLEKEQSKQAAQQDK